MHCREGKKGVEVLHTVYQYNHQSGTLHLPLHSGSCSPVAIKARHIDVLASVQQRGHASCCSRGHACMIEDAGQRLSLGHSDQTCQHHESEHGKI